MIEVVLALAATAGLGWLRPRWSSVSVAVVPAALALVWLLLHEEIPGERTDLDDIAWYAGMSAVVGVAFAAACGLGVATRRLSTGRRARSLR